MTTLGVPMLVLSDVPVDWSAPALVGLFVVLIATGRLVPYRQVKDWKDLYFTSEADRRRGIEAMERGADAIDATRRIVEAALGPIEKKARGEDPA